jgi:hypothetical protein
MDRGRRRHSISNVDCARNPPPLLMVYGPEYSPFFALWREHRHEHTPGHYCFFKMC